MIMKTRIIVLGAGYAGILTAKKLARRLKKRDEVQITIIDKNRYHTMLTELHEVAGNRVDADSIRVSLQRIFAGRKVEIITDRIKDIDYDRQILIGEGGQYAYDYLVLAAGSQPAFYDLPGVQENTFKLWSYTDAVRLRTHIAEVFEKALNENDPEVRRRLLTFYVVGAGFTGVEMAGELAEWLPQLCAEFEIDREDVRIVEVDMLDRVIPNLTEKLSAKAQRRLEKVGVIVLLKTTIRSVSADSIEYQREGEIIRDITATVIWTAGTECSDITKCAIQLKQVGRGRIQSDAFLHAEGRDNVYIGGDNLFYIPAGETKPVPQMVENCEHSASTIAHNLVTAITGEGKPKEYQPKFHGVMVSIGGRYGIAHVGTAKRKFALPSFLAMLVKHLINMVYFVQLLGWNKIVSYLKHEFFTIRHCRSILGGHFANRTPSFLLVPLRVFLGAFWVWEGIKKINEGWLQTPKLTAFFQGANDLFTKIIAGTPTGGTDAVASATGQAESAGTLLLNWNILGFLRIILINAGDIAVKIQFSLMDWFTQTAILRNDGTQLFFQGVIVISELLVGLALIGGLLTTLASAYSLILQIMFVMTTGLYLGTWWMVFAALAVLIGGGRIFGFDYYLIPWLKKHWKKVRLVRKLYLYHD
jgi:NADH:ubiquinone reductase (H+-translocating)